MHIFLTINCFYKKENDEAQTDRLQDSLTTFDSTIFLEADEVTTITYEKSIRKLVKSP